MSLTSTNPITPTHLTPRATRPSHPTPQPSSNHSTPSIQHFTSDSTSAVADRGIAKAVHKPVPATVYFDPEEHGRNAWCQFRFAAPLFLNFFFSNFMHALGTGTHLEGGRRSTVSPFSLLALLSGRARLSCSQSWIFAPGRST